MSEKTLKFGNIEVNKIEFHVSKGAITLDFINIDKIVISDKLKHNDNGSKHFIGYTVENSFRPLCIIFPQMSGYLKYFNNRGKNMSFKIEDNSVLVKYNQVWNKIKKSIGIKFHSKPVYDKKYIQAKVKQFEGVVNTVFWTNKIPKGGLHYICIAVINIDFIIKMEKKTILKFI